ncbi:hemolysin family protein [Nocardioides perillae]|uniref:Putative hemolysin n=1 Tax=Nocardioides perillae TaxID=1119534 RepID=A0A7Y9RRG8_9ACTN|nr:hemolysin family protein [Nocardioides perillae]NYG54985.1 putative hemolysin [Nocardioides perillae]
MDEQTLLNLGLVLLFVIVGGIFAGTELALVSLRQSQVDRIEQQSARGARVARVARDPNRFLAAVQIGVTVAGFFSAAYGGSTLAPDFAPLLEGLGLGESASQTVALVVLTLFIAYLSLVLGELVPKRIALQRSAQVSLLVAPPLDKFATLMRPVIWLLSVSTNAVVRLLGGDPHAVSEEVDEEELRDMVTQHRGLEEDQRRIVGDVLAASDTILREVMRPRADVAFVDGGATLREALEQVRGRPWSRYPVTGRGFDDVTGFLHVRDLLEVGVDDTRTVADVQRPVLLLPSVNKVLPTVATMRQEGTHLAVVVDEYGGTDGIVTLEDLVEELIGEIRDEHDAADEHDPGTESVADGGLSIEDFAERYAVEVPDGDYETVAGYLMAQLQRIPAVGDAVDVDGSVLEVAAMDGHRVQRIAVRRGEAPAEPTTAPSTPGS